MARQTRQRLFAGGFVSAEDRDRDGKKHTFFFITLLKLFGSSIFTSVSLGKMAADANEGAKAKVRAKRWGNNMADYCEY